ncbi:hypothetical protein [Breznakibacter xylanolyticus]|uniref:hypothetical protein n=1 Tax=Breznakibacter xylanolyticus TaxID=990 RepID=UPI0011B75B5C|nr:hypothetical protein [Breznakibacter xylanolyticus]
MKTAPVLECPHCHSRFSKDDLEKYCSNCFSCTGCEIYECPTCRKLIEVRPVGKPMRGRPALDDDAGRAGG